MLDQLSIGEEEKPEALKCEYCGFYFDYEEDLENWQHIEDTGMCCECPIK